MCIHMFPLVALLLIFGSEILAGAQEMPVPEDSDGNNSLIVKKRMLLIINCV